MDEIRPIGEIEIKILEDGKEEIKIVKNTVLNKGKEALARGLAGDIGTSFQFFVCKLQFGSNGTSGGVPKFVDATRNGLFGPVLLSKNTIATIDPASPTKTTFSAILTFNDLIGSTINELALQMANDNLYSMATFNDLTKTATIQITFSWSIFYV